MKQYPLYSLLALFCMVPAWAEPVEEVSPLPAAQADAAAPQLPEGEKRLRQGIVILGKICQHMADINNESTAEAAVAPLMRLCEELRQWTHCFKNLPPLSEPEVILYEDRYLPIIRKINKLMQDQADRLAAAEYYGSRNLAAALVHIAQVGH